MRAVSPVLPFFALTSAPLSSRSRTTSSCLCIIAIINAVQPPSNQPEQSHFALTLAPLSRRIRATDGCPRSAAKSKGVQPSLSLAFTSAPRSSKNLTVSLNCSSVTRPLPEPAALLNAPDPTLCTSAPLSRRTRKMSVWPSSAASKKAAFIASTSAPLSSKTRTVSMFPQPPPTTALYRPLYFSH